MVVTAVAFAVVAAATTGGWVWLANRGPLTAVSEVFVWAVCPLVVFFAATFACYATVFAVTGTDPFGPTTYRVTVSRPAAEPCPPGTTAPTTTTTPIQAVLGPVPCSPPGTTAPGATVLR